MDRINYPCNLPWFWGDQELFVREESICLGHHNQAEVKIHLTTIPQPRLDKIAFGGPKKGPPKYAVREDQWAETLNVICCSCKGVTELDYYRTDKVNFSFCPRCGIKFEGEFTRKNPRYKCPDRLDQTQKRTKLVARVEEKIGEANWFNDYVLADDLVFGIRDRKQFISDVKFYTREGGAKLLALRIDPPNPCITKIVFDQKGASPCQPTSMIPTTTPTTSPTPTFWSRLTTRLTGLLSRN